MANSTRFTVFKQDRKWGVKDELESAIFLRQVARIAPIYPTKKYATAMAEGCNAHEDQRLATIQEGIDRWNQACDAAPVDQEE